MVMLTGKTSGQISTMGVQIGIPIKSIIGSNIKATVELKIVMRFYEPALFDDASFVHKLAVSIVNS
jgi:hypothetical protein